MVNKDMNGFPVKKCSAFQFFKKRVLSELLLHLTYQQNTGNFMLGWTSALHRATS